MAGMTSNQLLDELIASDLAKRHFANWTAKEQEAAIRRCGLASSRFHNKSERTSILCNLHATALPIDPAEVDRLIIGLGLPPSGATSVQQFAYYLLSFMCDKMDFPPWNPQPVINIVEPPYEQLCAAARSVVKDRMQGELVKPHAYRLKNSEVRHLWTPRRQTWTLLMSNLDNPKSGLGTFLQDMSRAYIKVMNLVLAYSPKCSPTDLRCELDDAQYKVDRSEAPTLFTTAWNDAVKSLPDAPTIVCFKLCEWRWALGHLLVACKRAVAKSIRTQFDDDPAMDENVYVGDQVRVCVVVCVCVLTSPCLSCTTRRGMDVTLTIVLVRCGGQLPKRLRLHHVFPVSSQRCLLTNLSRKRWVYLRRRLAPGTVFYITITCNE